jgi:hypothetical protein
MDRTDKLGVLGGSAFAAAWVCWFVGLLLTWTELMFQWVMPPDAFSDGISEWGPHWDPVMGWVVIKFGLAFLSFMAIGGLASGAATVARIFMRWMIAAPACLGAAYCALMAVLIGSVRFLHMTPAGLGSFDEVPVVFGPNWEQESIAIVIGLGIIGLCLSGVAWLMLSRHSSLARWAGASLPEETSPARS